MGKYRPLEDWLAQDGEASRTLTFADVEKILRFRLPPAALTDRGWWANESSPSPRHLQSLAWLRSGWRVRHLDLEGQTVTFERQPVSASS